MVSSYCIWKRFSCLYAFFLNANVSYGTLGLVLCLFGMHSSAASEWALTKFSYSSFGVGVSNIFWSVSNLFLSVNVYWSLKSLLLLCVVIVRVTFLRRLSRVSLLWQFGDRRTHPRERNMPRNSVHNYFISYL